jgi:transposase
MAERRQQLVQMMTAARNPNGHAVAALPPGFAAIRSCLKRIAVLDKRQPNSSRNALMKRKAVLLLSAPGIGEVVAATLLGRLPELGDFSRTIRATLFDLTPLNRDGAKFKIERATSGGRDSANHVRHEHLGRIMAQSFDWDISHHL